MKCGGVLTSKQTNHYSLSEIARDQVPTEQTVAVVEHKISDKLRKMHMAFPKRSLLTSCVYNVMNFIKQQSKITP